MNTPLRGLRLAAGPLLLATLAACGGGGGDGGAAAPQINGDLAATTFGASTDVALDSVVTALDFGGTVEGVLPLDANAARAASTQEAAIALPHGRLERLLVRQLLRRSVGAQAQATETFAVACSGGGQLGLTATVASTDSVRAGDRIDVASQGCIENGLSITGTLALVISQFSETASGGSATIALSAGGFGSSALRVNGAATISAVVSTTQATLSVAYLGASATTPLITHTWDHSYVYTFVEATQAETLSFAGIARARGGATFQLRQDQPFTLTDTGVPSGGRLSFIDKDGDRVEVSADGLGFNYTFYVAGNPNPVAGPIPGLRHPTRQ